MRLFRLDPFRVLGLLALLLILSLPFEGTKATSSTKSVGKPASNSSKPSSVTSAKTRDAAQPLR
jgi:hypothetical protein